MKFKSMKYIVTTSGGRSAGTSFSQCKRLSILFLDERIFIAS